MSDTPIDPASETVEQGQRADDSYEGQKGYGIQYEDQQDLNGNFGQQPEGGRSGTFETNNTGGYGSNHTDADEQQNSLPSTPGGVPDQGQGGQ